MEGRPAWMARAVCRGEPIETFFPTVEVIPTGEPSDSAIGVPCRRECADYAIADPLIFGWWGGMSERERRKVRAIRAA